MTTRRAAVVGGNRIPFARSNSAYAQASNQDMLTAAIDGLVARFGLQGERIGEVAAGAVLKHSRDFNLTREAVLGSRLSPTTPAYDVQQACGTGLEAVVLVANKIALGQIESAIAGGVDTTSDAPDRGQRGPAPRAAAGQPRPIAGRPAQGARRAAAGSARPVDPANAEPRTGLSMGEHQAITTYEWGITREAQDELAAASHRNLAAAYDRGFFDDLLTPFLGLTRDQNLRPDSTPEQLAELPAGVRQALRRAGDDDGRQLDTAHRRRLRRCCWPATNGRPHRACRCSRTSSTPRRRPSTTSTATEGGRAADGAGVRGAPAARPQRADAAGLRLLRDPRGVRLDRAGHAGGLGGPAILPRPARPGRPARHDRPGEAERRTARRWRPGTRSPRPAGGSSPRWPSSCTRTDRAAG